MFLSPHGLHCSVGKYSSYSRLRGLMLIAGPHRHDRSTAIPSPVRFSSPPDPPLQLGRLIEQAVASVFGVEIADMLRPSRGRASIALARQVAMYLAHVVGRLRLSEVGRIFGRDRTTVAHACSVVENRRDEPGFNLTLDHLEAIIKRVHRLMFPASAKLI